MNKIIEKVIKDFDFVKVHDAMVATNWKWCGTDGVPSINELIIRAIGLLKEASEMDAGCSVSTVGFTATKLFDEEYGYGLQLEFILSETYFYEGEQE